MERSQLNIDSIRSFCDQGFSEGLRVEYKKDFPKNLKIAETICAFANTEGGIILVGVEADQTTNKPKDIPGTKLKDGLEEKVINICLSHISPTIAPEVKVCDFKSDPTKSKSDRAVVFIRVRSSYAAPHYLLDNNEIKVRVGSRNSLADLRTIEVLIDRRKSVAAAGALRSVSYDQKQITVENETFESVVVDPQYAPEPFIYFYNKENCDWLFKIANEVMRLFEQRPETWRLAFVALNSSKEITRYCSIDRWGKLVFQRPAYVEKDKFFSFGSITLLIKALKAAQKIYPHFGSYGDLSVGLTIVNTKNLLLGFPKYRHLEEFRCKTNAIRISKNLRYDELTHLNKIMEEIFKEICIEFGAIFPEQIVVDIVNEIFSFVK